MLKIANLDFAYKGNPVLNNVSLDFQPGITALIGPNGSGKSTLIKCMSGVLAPKGQISYRGKTVNEAFSEFYTTMISYLPQSFENMGSIKVFEAVLMGLLHKLSLRVGSEEENQVLQILKELNLQDLAGRYLSELSGGQRQMVAIAQALVKQPTVMLLDEPLNSLDIQHQFEILDIIKAVTEQKNIVTIMALHDLNLAMQYADQVVVLKQGDVFAHGEPSQVLTASLIKQVYQVRAQIQKDQRGANSIHLQGLAR